ncbi:uncharacterized protein LOC130674929 [Microplitis mediator]|uniref:uncharacterized protein LOC130674929 n=1 Tax=Microplitis mediator TaxID=375433 RepID=UPI0025554098|nr:uncharacterized protein LOC130674929 [Microplitis mediator]
MPKVKRREKVYGRDEIAAALADVKKGVPLRTASKSHGVPRSTLYAKFKNKTPIEAKPGPSTYLSQEEENQIIGWIFYLRDRGFSVTKNQLLDSVRDLIIRLGRTTPFTDSRPGRHWYEGFLRRHPDVAEKIIKNLTHSRASVTKKSLRHWFLEVKHHLEVKNLINIPGSRIFNAEVSRFQLSSKPDQIITRDSKKLNKDSANDRDNIETLLIINAAGDVVPPMVVYPYQRIPHNVSKNLPEGWFMSASATGAITGELIYDYIKNLFHPWVVENKIQLPVVLYVDGNSNLTLPLVNYCRKNNIELLGLCPNAAHLLQPMEVAVLRPLKATWKQVVNEHLGGNLKGFKKDNFAPLLDKALKSIDGLSDFIKSGFKTCGLHPFSIEVVNYNATSDKKNLDDDNDDYDDGVRESKSGDCADISDLSFNYDSEDYKNHLEFFEKHLSDSLLLSFKDSELKEVYDGDECNEGLFNYWLNMKKRCS